MFWFLAGTTSSISTNRTMNIPESRILSSRYGYDSASDALIDQHGVILIITDNTADSRHTSAYRSAITGLGRNAYTTSDLYDSHMD